MKYLHHTQSSNFQLCVAIMTNEMMLIEKLKAHPEVTKRVPALIDITESESGSFDRADEAEDAIIMHFRQLQSLPI